MRLGLPRALLYYQYYPMWRTFFEHLGAETVVSSPTTRRTLTMGAARVVSETCLPTKVFCGHVIELADKCDYIFVPSIRSIEERVYNCSKFLGLPDVVKAVVPEAPPILAIDVDINKGKRSLYQAIYRLGRHFSWNPLKVKEASEAAWRTHLDYQTFMRTNMLTPLEALAQMYGEELGAAAKDAAPTAAARERGITIAVIGHPYNMYDEYINHKLLGRLNKMGIRVMTPEMASIEELDRGVEKLVGRPYWTYEDEVVGAGGHYLDAHVDGVISVVAFGCGPDSVMIDVVQRYAKTPGHRPFMSLTIDEHTGEAGLVTRLEAFVDMIERKGRPKRVA